MAAKTLQYGIKGGNTSADPKSFETFGYWLNGIDVTHQSLDLFTPYTRGVSRIFWHKLPPFMSTAFGPLSKTFKTYFETGYTAIDGIGDISVDFTEFEGGFAGQRFSNVQLARDDTESITVSMYELSGSPVRNYIDLWVTGTRDPRSGIAHYHGSGDEYKETNHTGELVYANLDPTGIDCEYVAMFAHVFPTKVPKSHLNYEHGNRENALLDLEFRVTKYESPAINEIGKWYIRNSQIKYNYLDFDPGVLNADGSIKTTPSGYTSGYTYDYASYFNDNGTVKQHDIKNATDATGDDANKPRAYKSNDGNATATASEG